MTGLLALAFGAGLLAPVNPCGFGLLPAVLTATSGGIGSTDNPGATLGPLARLSAGLRNGLALALGSPQPSQSSGCCSPSGSAP